MNATYEGRRLAKIDGSWCWICPICHTARPVSESKRCGKCGVDTMSSAGRRLGAAQRNLGDALRTTAPGRGLEAIVSWLNDWIYR